MQVSGAQQGNPSAFMPEAVGKQELGKDEFLQLLVTQLQNQDPLQPMSNTEFVAQLAQFSSVEQLVGVNEGVNMLGMGQISLSNNQAASMIGNEVEIRSDQIQVGEGDESVSAAFTLDGDAEQVTVNIRDGAGKVVRTIELGSTLQGETPVEWDCRDDNGVMVPPGAFRLDVQAKDADGNSVTWQSRVRGTVTGVDYESGYPEIMIGSVKADMSDILGVYPEPGVGP